MIQFNLPPGVTLQDLEPTKRPSTEDFFDRLDRAYDQHVDRCLAEGKDWRPGSAPVPPNQQSHSIAPLRACTYPARPVNGGSLDRALPKAGHWLYEPKYNGWRALAHAPTATMFNRYGERLTIQREFSDALILLQRIHLLTKASLVEWFDCEALERRHGLGQGTLMVFDYVVPGNHESYLERKAKLALVLPLHEYAVPPEPDRAYSVVACSPARDAELEFYHSLKQLNRNWRCPFYEGVVAKRADSLYPVQLRSPTLEFPGWVKHRWAG